MFHMYSIWSICCTIRVFVLPLTNLYARLHWCVCLLYVWDVCYDWAASLTEVVLGTGCWEQCTVLFCCANSSLSHVCPWCPKIHKEYMYTHAPTHPPTFTHSHTHQASRVPKGREAHSVISGAVLPCPCSFIAALHCGGVALCPNRQSGQGVTEHPLKAVILPDESGHNRPSTWKERPTVSDHGYGPMPLCCCHCCSPIPSLPWFNLLSSSVAFHSISAVLDTMPSNIM